MRHRALSYALPLDALKLWILRYVKADKFEQKPNFMDLLRATRLATASRCHDLLGDTS